MVLRTFLVIIFLTYAMTYLWCLSARPELLSLSTLAIWGRITLWSCPVHCRMLSNIPGIYPLDANNFLRVETTKNVCKYCPISRRTKSPLVEIPSLVQYFSTLAAYWNHPERFRNCCQCSAPFRPINKTLWGWGVGIDSSQSVLRILVGLRIENLCPRP